MFRKSVAIMDGGLLVMAIGGGVYTVRTLDVRNEDVRNEDLAYT